MTKIAPIYVGKGETKLYLLPKMANRHGLIAGATGTGKTVSLQQLAQNFSRLGIPVFTVDIKGDLSGISLPGNPNPDLLERIQKLDIQDFNFESCPTIFWDIFGELGHPIRATVNDMGPLLLSRMLNLNEIQSSVLTLLFKISDENGLLLLDLKDLRSMLQYVGEHASQFTTQYGMISSSSIGAIQRALLELEHQGGEHLFGEPTIAIEDLMQQDKKGQGYVNILAAQNLMQAPKLYSTFLLWILSELYEKLPEVGDLEKPKLIFFFDEAHLLFTDAPKPLLEKIEQVVRLVRSKGVGIYFCTQNPTDIPLSVLGQLGNRFQHALRAYTPKDQKAVKAAAETFRPNPKFKTAEIITQLSVGEALVSLLDQNGTPEKVEKTLICPPSSQIGAIASEQRKMIIAQSPFLSVYDKKVDRISAYEMLKKRTEEAPQKTSPQTSYASYAKEAWKVINSRVGRDIIRGILGTIFGGGTRRR